MGYRPPAIAVLGAMALLPGGAAVLGVATSRPTDSGATAFARSVLAEATIPPGGQPATALEAVGRWLDGPHSTPSVQGLDDVHAFYLYDEPPKTVVHAVGRHLPPGATTADLGNATGLATFVTVTVPVSGANEYMATLSYSVAPTNWTLTRSKLRIDAETVWVPSRPAAEHAPTRGVVTVTGFRASAPRTPGRGPVSVVVSSRRAQRLVQALRALPPGARVDGMEWAPLWRVSVSPSAGAPAAFVASDEGCAGAVGVTMSGRPMPVLVARRCTILRGAAALLPPRARATRWAATRCTNGLANERRPG